MVKNVFRSRLVRATVIAAAAMLASPAFAFAAPAAGDDCPTVQVSGNGKASATADIAKVNLTVETKAPDAEAAMADNAAATRRVTNALITAGVGAKDIQTAGLSLYPDYDYTTTPHTITGYRAAQQLDVVLRDLIEAGAALDAAVEAGQNATRINWISFEVSDNKALLAKAREAAVADARAKAEQYAKLTGNTLGQVRSITEQSATPPTLPPVAMPIAGAPSESTPIRPSEVGVYVTVDIVWELVPNSQGQSNS